MRDQNWSDRHKNLNLAKTIRVLDDALLFIGLESICRARLDFACSNPVSSQFFWDRIHMSTCPYMSPESNWRRIFKAILANPTIWYYFGYHNTICSSSAVSKPILIILKYVSGLFGSCRFRYFLWRFQCRNPVFVLWSWSINLCLEIANCCPRITAQKLDFCIETSIKSSGIDRNRITL